MTEPVKLGSVASGNAPKAVVLGSVAAGNKPKTVVLGSVAQQQAANASYSGQLAAAATSPAGTATSGSPWLTYVIIAIVVLGIGYYLYNRRGGNSR
ncbi:hypothetical protein M0R72_06065 [Candidatus Pacearchaeota archaeon]|jgi:hypothetical protein|nr:hypothetical protein [Candidatus Pacearchaeota archaeon]